MVAPFWALGLEVGARKRVGDYHATSEPMRELLKF